MTARLFAALLVLMLVVSPAAAHNLQHSVREGRAVLMELAYADGQGFAYEAYEIYPRGAEVPVQVGRTDAHGRIAFAPAEPGDYQVRVFSQDGHGAVFDLQVGEDLALAAAERPALQRHERIFFIVLGVLLGVFGLLIFYRRKSP